MCDVKRVLPFPSACVDLIHSGAAALDEWPLASIRLSDPFVVILDKAAWRRQLAAATTARISNTASTAASTATLPLTAPSAPSTAASRKRYRQCEVSADMLEATTTSHLQLQHAIGQQRSEQTQHEQQRPAEGKEREGKDSEDVEAVQYDHYSSTVRRYRQPHQQHQRGGGEADGVDGASDVVNGSGGSQLSSGAALDSVSSRLRSSLARVEQLTQLREARDRLVQMQHRSRQQQPPAPPVSIRPSSGGSMRVGRVELEQLAGMGFEAQSAAQALKRCGGNLGDAIELLMSHNHQTFID